MCYKTTVIVASTFARTIVALKNSLVLPKPWPKRLQAKAADDEGFHSCFWWCRGYGNGGAGGAIAPPIFLEIGEIYGFSTPNISGLKEGAASKSH